MAKFRSASLNQYVSWLEKYMRAGGQPTHFYEYPWARAGIVVATQDFTIGGECGVDARSILVPSHVKFLGGNLGHNNLYFEDSLTCRGGWVPVYGDPEFYSLPNIENFIAGQRARRLDSERERQARNAEYKARTKGSDLTEYNEYNAARGVRPVITGPTETMWSFFRKKV